MFYHSEFKSKFGMDWHDFFDCQYATDTWALAMCKVPIPYQYEINKVYSSL